LQDTQKNLYKEHLRRGVIIILFLSNKYALKNIKNATGYDGELYAAHYLIKKRYKLVDARYTGRFGEIDLIVRNKNFIVFVEVKLRKNKNFGTAGEAVTYSKQQKIVKTALQWIKTYKCDLQPRFDVVEIYTELGEINHIENAFA